MQRVFPFALAVFSSFAFAAQAQTETPPAEAPLAEAPPAEAPPAEAPPEVVQAPVVIDGWTVVKTTSDKKYDEGAPNVEECGWQQDVVVEKADAPGEQKPATIKVECKTDAYGAKIAGPQVLDFPAPPVSPEAMQKAVATYEKLVASCQSKDPAARGLLNFHWIVMPDGSTSAIKAEGGTLKSPLIQACVEKEIAGWRLLTHFDPAGVPVDYAFGFDGAMAAAAPTCLPNEKPKAAKDLKPGELACVEPKRRPCNQGEKPLPIETMPAGELPCVDPGSDRGVPFLKGELTHFGDVQITNVKNSVGVAIGAANIDDAFFAILRPDINLHFAPFQLGLGAPLLFEVMDFSEFDAGIPETANTIFSEAGRFRTEDWDQIEDFLRPIRYVTWGRKEDNLYVSVNRVHSVTLGHGQLVRRYTPNVDIDEDRLVAAVDGYNDLGGVEILAGPFPVPRVAGALLFVKPLGIARAFQSSTAPADPKAPPPPETYADMAAKSWSIGLTYMTDLNSPTTLEKQTSLADGRLQLAVDDTNQLIWRGKTNPVGDVVTGFGVDSEVKVLKNDFIDIKTYGDYSHLFFPADSATGTFDAFSGGGAALGGLIRMSLGETPLRPIEQETDDVRAGKSPREKKAQHALRFRLEGRMFDPHYLPSYFNSLYEIDRLQYGLARGNDRGALPTKVGFLSTQDGQPMRLGMYSELSYAWVDGFGVTAVYEDALPLGNATNSVSGRNFALHAETGGLGFLQLFATYHARNFEDFSTLFSFNTDNEILYAGSRITLLPILFVNIAAQRSFRVGFGEDDLAKQENSEGLRFSSVGMQNVWSGVFDVELGWQF